MDNGSAILTIAVSSRALFDMDADKAYFHEHGSHAYRQYQIGRKEELVEFGVAYDMVKRLLAVNVGMTKRAIDVVLLSGQDSHAGYRCMNTIEKSGLDIQRAIFTGGKPTHSYLKPLGVDLFLSASSADVREASQHGVAAATIVRSPDWKRDDGLDDNELRIAFDGDSVLFSNESEKYFREHGEKAFHDFERLNAEKPMTQGPFANILKALHGIQEDPSCQVKIVTALVTARSVAAFARAMNTFDAWGIGVDEAMFLCGAKKGPFLDAFRPHFYFDDSREQCEAAASGNIPTGHVPNSLE